MPIGRASSKNVILQMNPLSLLGPSRYTEGGEASLLALPVSVIAIAEDSDSDATETETDCRLRNKLAYFSLWLAYFSLRLASSYQYFKKRQLLIDP